MAHAHYLVAEQAAGWFVSFEHNRYGPYPGGRIGALIAAVQSAQQAGKDGHDASVCERSPDGSVRTVWVFGTDSYPPTWAEELLREVSRPKRPRAVRPPVACDDAPSSGSQA